MNSGEGDKSFSLAELSDMFRTFNDIGDPTWEVWSFMLELPATPADIVLCT